MARRNQMDDFMVGQSRYDPNEGRRPGEAFVIATDNRPVGDAGLNESERQQFQDFLNISGRGDKLRGRTNITGRDAAKLARMQFDQFRNLQRGGDYAPSLKPGMRVPGGTIQRVPQEGGLAGFLGRGGFIGNFLGDIGGNAPRTIRPVDSGPSGRRARGSFNLNTGRSSAINPDVGRRDVLSRMITQRPSANIPVGGITETSIARSSGPSSRRGRGSFNLGPAPVTLVTSPSSTDQTVFGSDIFEEAVGATPEESGTFIIGDKILPVDTQERFFTTEGVTPEEQAYLNEIRDDDLADDYSTGPVTRFERAMADRLALLQAAQDAADATELAEINMLMRGRELADRDAGNTALQDSIGQAIAAAQIRDAERAAANQAVMDAVRDEQSRQADLEEMFMEPNLDLMPFMESLEKFIEDSTYRAPEVVPDNEGDDRMLRSGMIVGPMGL